MEDATNSMIDLHCHLLSGIDDGPRSESEMLAMARAHLDAGVQVVACTPHVDSHTPNTASEIARAVDRAIQVLDSAGIPLQVVTGGEVGLTRALELTDDELQALRLGGSRWLLLEAPLNARAGVEEAVLAVVSRGHEVLLAHPERCPAFQREPKGLRRLLDFGVLTQVTASALTGAFGSTVERFSRELVRGGMAHVVASDAHDTRRRPPGLHEHIAAAGLADCAAYLTSDAPAAILSGGRIPPRRALPLAPRSRWWHRS